MIFKHSDRDVQATSATQQLATASLSCRRNGWSALAYTISRVLTELGL